MKREKIIIGTLILTVATTSVRLVGMFFRIYLANTLGSEGIGLYQLILSIFFLMVTLATSGIRVAISKLISEQIALGNYSNAKKVLHQSIGISIFTGFAAGAILYYFADYIGSHILNDNRTVLALLYLAPSLPIMAISNCYKGYFYALGKVTQPSIIQMTEQFVRIFLIIYLMGTFLPKGLEYGCAAVAIGMTAEEIFALFLVWFFYIFDKKPHSTNTQKKAPNMIFKILNISVPISATSYINSILRTVENTLIPARLLLYGLSSEMSISLYGMIKGMVLPLLFFPSSILTSLSSLLIPAVAGDNALANEKSVSRTLSQVIHFTTISGILVVAVFVSFPNEIAMAVYNDRQVGLMIKLISYVCPFMYLNMVISSMLNALGEQVSSFVVNIIESILKIFIIYVFIPVYGFNAYLFALFITTILNTILYLFRLLQVSSIVFDISDWIIKPIIAAGIAGILSKYSYILFMQTSHHIISLISSICILCLIYLMGLIIFKSIRLDSINDLKKYVNRNA
ncbi:MAG: polysaccharide biosynthesis protein [Tissierellia bacterium]|nr:polysaccharide biosynthesis protein [Tissierellia bacterium]